MPSLAKQLTKEQVETALEYIIENKPVLNPSTQHNLLYKGLEFPPKEVVRWAARLVDLPNWETMTLSGGDNTNLPLRDLGFVITDKNKKSVEQELIDKYKFIVKDGNADEVYKWQLIEKYKGRPRLDADDFGAEIMEIDYRNLIYHNGIAVRNHIAKEKPEEYRKAFIKLFDENEPLKERVAGFRKDIDIIYKSLGQTLQNHHDERTIATFLAFYNPDEYPLYKNSFYSKYCKALKIKEAGTNEKYLHYLDLIVEFTNDYILNDEDIIEIKNGFLTNDSYHDGNNLILAQDILYQTLDKRNMNFKEIIAEVKQMLQAETDNPKFSVLESTYGKSGSREWVWIGDEVRTIGSEMAHYELEIDEKKGDKIILSLHFEDVKNKSQFSKIIGEQLPSDLKWFTWFKSKSIRFIGSLNLNDEDIVAKIINALTQFDEKIGDHIRKIIGDWKNQLNAPQNLLKVPLNQILYGPPGTGKTYHTINKALEILGVETKNQTREFIKGEFDKFTKEGRIVFTTFHQSLSYEDFIEGIKPQEPKGDQDPISYLIEDGIFKKICIDAETPNQGEFESAFQNLRDELGKAESGVLDLTTPTGKSFSISLNRNDNLSLHTGPKKEKQGVLTKENLQKQINGEDKFIGWEGYFAGVINYLKTKYKYRQKVKDANENNNYVLIADEINRGNVSQIFGELITLIEESKRAGQPETLKVKLPYSKKEFSVPSNVYIIGTMNTADRSVESLDTALRRRFCFEEMMPDYDLLKYNYSSHQQLVKFHEDFDTIEWENWSTRYKDFAVNFYSQIGLDFAIGEKQEKDLSDLIRSYQFDIANANEYLAEYKVVEPVNLGELLSTINKRIELLYDREHQIGHTFFLKVKESYNLYKDLRNVFKNEIIPLLQEYFFGDYEKLGLVLGQGFIKTEEPKGKFFADFKGSTPSDYFKPVYSIKSEVFDNDENFKKALNLTINVKPEVLKSLESYE